MTDSRLSACLCEHLLNELVDRLCRNAPCRPDLHAPNLTFPDQPLRGRASQCTASSPHGMKICAIFHPIEIYHKHNLPTLVLAASIRHPLHIIEAAKAGADIATVPYKVLEQAAKHPLTDKGIETFLADWKKFTAS